MGCCIAIALVIGLVRQAWFRLLPSRAPVAPGFAPPARRPAPGTAEPQPPRTVPVPRDARPTRASAAGFAGAALGLGAYAAAVATAAAAGVLTSSRPLTGWLVIIAVAVAAARPGWRAPHRDRLLVAAGLAWFAASELDAHVLHAVGHSTLLHAPGPLLMSIGLVLRFDLLPSRRVAAPSLHSGTTS